MFKSILVLLVALNFAACVKIKSAKDNEKKSESGEVPSAPLSPANDPGDLEYVLEGQEEPNKYLVRFDLKNLDLNQLVVQKKAQGTTQMLAVMVDENKHWIDANLPSGEVINYRFGYLRQSQFETFAEGSITVPTDYVVKGERKLSLADIMLSDGNVKKQFEIKGFHRIFFEKEARLITNGIPLVIEAEEIFSQNGRISTFPENAKAEAGKDGRSGGDIKIFARRAYGELSIYMRGEQGGEGLEGKKPDASLKGERGIEGIDAIFTQDYIYCNEPGCDHRYFFCQSQPTDGRDGGPGRQGYPGGRGGNGGATGNLNIEIESAEKFYLVIEKQKGTYGRGGLGGEGGEGGDGGRPGNAIVEGAQQQACKVVKPGRKGAQGVRGPNGLDGYEGTEGTICENLNSRKVCR